LEVPDSLLDYVAHFALLTRVQPEAVLFIAGVDLEVVGAVIEGLHCGAAHRASELAISPRVLNCRDTLLFGRRDRRLQVIEFLMVEPAAVARRTVIDFYPVVVLDFETNLAARTIHNAPNELIKTNAITQAPRHPTN
jgi:hypothetical protein